MGAWGMQPRDNDATLDLWDDGGRDCENVTEKKARARCAELKVERVYKRERPESWKQDSGWLPRIFGKKKKLDGRDIGDDAWYRAGVLQIAMDYGYKPTPKIAEKTIADLSELTSNKEWLLGWDPGAETAVKKNIKQFSARVKRAASKG